MQVNSVIRFVLDRTGKSDRAIGPALGKGTAWAGMAASGRIPKLDTLARVADLAGLDVALVDRSSGDVVAVVDVPTD